MVIFHQLVIRCINCHELNKIILGEAQGKFLCSSCKTCLIEQHKILKGGYIYLLSNPAMPRLVKIGYCRKSVEERVKELNSATGVPKPFLIEAYFISESPEEDEKKVHREISKYRLENREFFDLSVAKAVETVGRILGSRPVYLNEYLTINERDSTRTAYKDASRQWHKSGQIGLRERTLCSDGNCIGIIGPDGRCTECGKTLK